MPAGAAMKISGSQLWLPEERLRALEGMPQQERRQVVCALQGVIALEPRQRLFVIDALLALFEEHDIAPRLRARAVQMQAAIDDLDRAANLLGLAGGEPIKVEQYKRIAVSEGLTPLHAVISSCGSWREANALRLERTSGSSPHQVALRYRLIRRRRSSEHPVTGVARWLATGPASTAKPVYEAFARWWNDAHPEQLQLVRASTATTALGVSWRELVSIAAGQRSLAEVQTARLRAGELLPADYGALVGIQGVARVLGVVRAEAQALVEEESFPSAAVWVRPRGGRAWRVDDVRAYAEGAVRDRPPGWLQERIMLSPELASLRELAAGSLSAYLCTRRWDKVPEPAGRAANAYWWWRRNAEAWVKAFWVRQENRGRPNPQAGGRSRERRSRDG